MQGLKEDFVQAGQYRTHYGETGSGEVVIVLHSADPGSSGALEFRNNIGPLSQHYRVIAPDIIGFGQSDPPNGLLTHPAYVEHMLAFIDALGLQRYNLIGNSRGGLVAISVAAERPNQVGRLICAGNAGGGIPPEMQARALAPFANYTPTPENLRAVVGRSYFDFDTHVPQPIFDQYLENSKRQYDAYAKLGGYPMDVPNLRPQLADLRVPVMFFFGKEDEVFHVDQALVGFQGTPNSRFIAFSNCGHHPQVEKANAFNKIAIQFLQGELD
jgi:pimeloyl-ACP methyl ester carboxylesterase